jgi:hypothetical protein
MLKAAFGRGRRASLAVFAGQHHGADDRLRDSPGVRTRLRDRATSTAGIEGAGVAGPPPATARRPHGATSRSERQLRAWQGPRVPGRIGSGGNRQRGRRAGEAWHDGASRSSGRTHPSPPLSNRGRYRATAPGPGARPGPPDLALARDSMTSPVRFRSAPLKTRCTCTVLPRTAVARRSDLSPGCLEIGAGVSSPAPAKRPTGSWLSESSATSRAAGVWSHLHASSASAESAGGTRVSRVRTTIRRSTAAVGGDGHASRRRFARTGAIAPRRRPGGRGVTPLDGLRLAHLRPW